MWPFFGNRVFAGVTTVNWGRIWLEASFKGGHVGTDVEDHGTRTYRGQGSCLPAKDGQTVSDRRNG